MENKIWFITGVSSGLGRHLAEQAARMGHTVIGTVRNKEQLQDVNDLVDGKTFGVQMDVNNHTEVKEVITSVVEKYGRIDVLVNNAGYGYVGAIEEAGMEDVREQMETNFFGALAVTQAVLPVMRAQKSGHIIQISSQAGVSSAPGLGIYNASKYALEGFSEALYKETTPLGIHVSLVEPGPFRTEWAGRSMKHAPLTIEDYTATAGKVKQNLELVNGRQPGDPVKAALAIIKLTTADAPPLRLALGKGSVDTIRRKLEWHLKELSEWEKVSLDTDFTV